MKGKEVRGIARFRTKFIWTDLPPGFGIKMEANSFGSEYSSMTKHERLQIFTMPLGNLLSKRSWGQVFRWIYKDHEIPLRRLYLTSISQISFSLNSRTPNHISTTFGKCLVPPALIAVATTSRTENVRSARPLFKLSWLAKLVEPRQRNAEGRLHSFWIRSGPSLVVSMRSYHSLCFRFSSFHRLISVGVFLRSNGLFEARSKVSLW